jgi:serine/threonine protein phosphatase PrpC
MEDEFFVAEGGRFVAIFDGHGGGDVSRYLRDNLYKKMRYYLYEESEDEYLERFKNHDVANVSAITHPSEQSTRRSPSIAHICMALRSSIRAVEREVLSHQLLQHQGSTAVAVALHESDSGTRTLISANVGDSRAILSRRGQAIDLTRDHKPNDPKEKARILSMGETVEYDGYGGVWRVRGLSVSRAIGDGYAKPILSGEVEIKRFPLGEKGADEFIVLASDGLWDVMESQDVVNYVHAKLQAPVPMDENDMMTKRMRRRHISRYLSNEAMRRGSGDNISVIVVWLCRELT